MADDAFDDVFNAIANLRIAFMRHGIEPPKSIELSTYKDKDIFLHKMPRDMVLAQPRMGETRKDAEWVANIMGVEIRMPAQWRTDLDGRSKLT